MLESLANPLESPRVRLQVALQSVAERAGELGVLLVQYSKPRSAHVSQQECGYFEDVGIFVGKGPK